MVSAGKGIKFMLLFHEIYTVLLFLSFIIIIYWVWNKKYQTYFNNAALLPFLDDSHNEPSIKEENL